MKPLLRRAYRKWGCNPNSHKFLQGGEFPPANMGGCIETISPLFWLPLFAFQFPPANVGGRVETLCLNWHAWMCIAAGFLPARRGAFCCRAQYLQGPLAHCIKDFSSLPLVADPTCPGAPTGIWSRSARTHAPVDIALGVRAKGKWTSSVERKAVFPAT